MSALEFKKMLLAERAKAKAMRQKQASVVQEVSACYSPREKQERLSLGEYAVPGLKDVYYIPDFVSKNEEEQLKTDIYGQSEAWIQLTRRRLQKWGGTPHPNGMTPKPIPPHLKSLMRQLTDAGVFAPSSPVTPPVPYKSSSAHVIPQKDSSGNDHSSDVNAGGGDNDNDPCNEERGGTISSCNATTTTDPDADPDADISTGPAIIGPANHVLLNEYRDGQGIAAHNDGELYEPLVAVLSLCGPAAIDFLAIGGGAKGGGGEDGTGDILPPTTPVSAAATAANTTATTTAAASAPPTSSPTYTVPVSAATTAATPPRAGGLSKQQQRVGSVLLRPRSLLVFGGGAYTHLLHEIPSRPADAVDGLFRNRVQAGVSNGDVVSRGSLRLSLTIRRAKLKLPRNSSTEQRCVPTPPPPPEGGQQGAIAESSGGGGNTISGAAGGREGGVSMKKAGGVHSSNVFTSSSCVGDDGDADEGVSWTAGADEEERRVEAWFRRAVSEKA